MTFRPLWFWVGLACLGCQSFVPLEPGEERESAGQLWEDGQQAMRRGRPDEAVACYERSLLLDPNLVRNHLSLAAAHLEQGDEETACAHLKCYVQANPEHLAVRVHLADLLLRLRKLPEARHEFERCIAGAQEQGELACAHLIHCHARLMEIAESIEDDYDEHLHRGIGLLLLAQQRAILPDPEGELPAEGLLCKAAGELTLARTDRPAEARPNWYLHEVWSRLAQRQPAMRCLRAAVDAAPFSYLTGAEKRNLHVAWQCVQSDRIVK